MSSKVFCKSCDGKNNLPRTRVNFFWHLVFSDCFSVNGVQCKSLVSSMHSIFCMRSVSVTLKTTLDFEYMCCQRDIAKQKIFMKFGILFCDRKCVSVSVRIILHAKCVCVCACVCFQYCCHVITQYYLFVLWILCMFFLLPDPRGCA